jgi:hypothetical protein
MAVSGIGSYRRRILRGADPMKFPFEVEPAPISRIRNAYSVKTIVASLWACFKYAVIVFVIVWAIMQLFGM